MTAHAVREALRGGPSREAQLRTLADEARSQLWGFFQVGCKRSAHAYSAIGGLISRIASVVALPAASWADSLTVLSNAYSSLTSQHKTVGFFGGSSHD